MRFNLALFGKMYPSFILGLCLCVLENIFRSLNYLLMLRRSCSLFLICLGIFSSCLALLFENGKKIACKEMRMPAKCSNNRYVEV